jgi:membrane-associated phospholipid phosphatase
MGWDGPRGFSYNSFPSGHAASCAVLIALVYLFPKHRVIERAVTTSTLIVLTTAMAIGRSMAGMHWLSDSIASFFIVWAVVDLVAHWQFERKL